MLNKIERMDSTKSLIDSKTWGNYYKGEEFTYSGRTSKWDSKQYTFGGVVENETKSNQAYFLLSTGASDHNRTYNIYDVAGNLWEWTEESAAAYNSITTLTTNYVFRGGSFADDSSVFPACFHAIGADSYTVMHVGFRVVLYIK